MKILSIDGGGIKGLLTASFFATLEKRFISENRKLKRISEYFDLIVGTSTGGIIALALANDISAEQIVDFFKIKGPEIFKKKPLSFNGILSSIYDNVALRNALIEVFGKGKTLKEMYEKHSKAVCITATNSKNCNPLVYKTPHHEKLLRQLDVKLWEIALATSAAPIFFPIANVDNKMLVDGGLWANNPSYIGLTEALGQYFGKKLNEISILSVGNISSYTAMNNHDNLQKGAIGWGTLIVTMTLDAQAAHVDYSMRQLFNNDESSYCRIEDDKVNDANQLIELSKLDNVSPQNIKHLIERGEQLASEYAVGNRFKHFFKEEG